MLAVQKWAQGKNPVIAFFAINLALVARMQCEALRHIKDRSIFGHQFPLPDLPSWFEMYHSRKPILAYKRLISHSNEFADELIDIMVEFRKAERYLKKNSNLILNFTHQEIETELARCHDLCSKTFLEIEDDLSRKRLDPEFKQRFSSALIQDELTLGFYFLVHAPCFLLYGTSPSKLYRKAVNCDLSAIEQLLRLDPLVLHDPAIGYQIQSIRLKGKSKDYDRLLNAISKNPRVSYQDMRKERKTIKTDHAASIYAFTKVAKNPLTLPQIRSLFDELAKDFEGTMLDTDITSPEGFDKTVKMKAAVEQKKTQKPEKQK